MRRADGSSLEISSENRIMTKRDHAQWHYCWAFGFHLCRGIKKERRGNENKKDVIDDGKPSRWKYNEDITDESQERIKSNRRKKRQMRKMKGKFEKAKKCKNKITRQFAEYKQNSRVLLVAWASSLAQSPTVPSDVCSGLDPLRAPQSRVMCVLVSIPSEPHSPEWCVFCSRSPQSLTVPSEVCSGLDPLRASQSRVMCVLVSIPSEPHSPEWCVFWSRSPQSLTGPSDVCSGLDPLRASQSRVMCVLVSIPSGPHSPEWGVFWSLDANVEARLKLGSHRFFAHHLKFIIH
jgi:hypothetical protein